MKNFLEIFGGKPAPCLKELDTLYSNVVTELPTETRIEYCKGLIERCKLDLQQVDEKCAASRFRQTISAAENELRKLNAKLPGY